MRRERKRGRERTKREINRHTEGPADRQTAGDREGEKLIHTDRDVER